MKTTLIVLVVLAILSVAMYLIISTILVRKSKQAKVNDSDDKTKDGCNDDNIVKEDGCLQEGVNYDKETKELVKKEENKDDKEEEVHIPEHCKMYKYDGHMPNKYFFNIHKYTSKRGKQMYCLVCSAIINDENHRIIVKNSYYPYLGSYTLTVMNKIESMFENKKMSVEEFKKLGSTNFDNLGEIVIYNLLTL